MITIKNLTVDDINEAIQLRIMCWTEELAGKAENNLDFSEEQKFWVHWMNSSEENKDVRILIGAYEDDKMLGVAFASFADAEDIPENGIELNGLWVYPEQRGRGVSLKLITYLLDSFKKIGKEKIVIYNPHYAPSNQFYRKFGAQVIKQVKQMDGKLLIDVFIADINVLLSNIEKSLSKYNMHFI